MTDKFYARPIIPLLLSMISGIAVGTGLPGYGTWAYIGVGVCTGILVYRIWKKRTALSQTHRERVSVGVQTSVRPR